MGSQRDIEEVSKILKETKPITRTYEDLQMWIVQRITNDTDEELLAKDIVTYGSEEEARIHWVWQYKDRASQGEWFECDKPIRLNNPYVNYMRKSNLAPFKKI